MDVPELSELALSRTDRIKQALFQGRKQQALELGRRLPKDYFLMLRGMRQIVEATMAWVEEEFLAQEQRISEEIERAISEDQVDHAFQLLDKKQERFRMFHDKYVDFFAELKSYVLQHFGAEKLFEMLRWTGTQLRKDLFDRWASLSTEERVRAMVFTMQSHLGQLRVEEDDDKFTLINDPCGTGGRLLRSGRYEGPNALLRVSEPSEMTLQRADFQSYCTHCPVWLSILAIEWYGFPLWVVEPPKRAEDVCHIHIYKDATKVPREYIQVIGKSKPELG